MSKKLLSFLGFVLCLFALDAQIIIGKTRYDLQTNNSVQRRAFLDPTNNFLAITYTGSNLTDGAYEDRGTGYAMFNTITNTWIDKSAPFMPPKTTFPGRIEDKRVGWGEPAIVNGKELIISHQSSDGFNGLYMAERSISSLGAYAYKSVTSGKETWPRMAVSGNKIVVISSHFESQFNDVDGGLMFIKSSDGGVTWTAPDSIKGANGINPTNYSGLGGDNYAVDLRGDVIAILTGVYDLTLYKSTDFGVTWTKTNLGRPTSDNFFLDNGEFLTPFDRSDGSYSVLIDNDNKVHCFWGRSYTYGDEEQDIASVFINRFKHGIMYWSENNPKAQVIPQTAFQRESTKQHDDITLKFNTAGTNGSELSYLGSGAVYGSSPVTWPSAGIDDAGNIYLTYGYNRGRLDTTNEGLNKDRDPSGYNFYDVFAIKLMKSDPNKWIGPLNVSQTNTLEETYPSIARRVDGNLHVVYQQDNLVGNAIVTTRDANNNPQNGSGSQVGGIETDNSIVYKKVPVNDINAFSSR
nr:hypothetical protein [Chitinophagales bacterium]